MKIKILLVLTAFVSMNVFAAGYVTVQIESIAIVGNAALGAHAAENMELKVKGGFTLPSGISCDTNYITTKKDMYSNKTFALLLAAKTSQQPVTLIVADDANYSAFPGRCSILAVTF